MDAQLKDPNIPPCAMRINLPFAIASQVFKQSEKGPSFLAHRRVAPTSHLHESVDRKLFILLLDETRVRAGDRLVASSSCPRIDQYVAFQAVVVRILDQLSSRGNGCEDYHPIDFA